MKKYSLLLPTASLCLLTGFFNTELYAPQEEGDVQRDGHKGVVARLPLASPDDGEWEDVDRAGIPPVNPDEAIDAEREDVPEQTITEEMGDDDKTPIEYTLVDVRGGRHLSYILLLEKAWDRVGGAGTLMPDDEGAERQRTGRRIKTFTLFALDITLPFVMTAALRKGFSYFFEKATPVVVSYMGEKAAQAASGPSCSHTSTFWSYFSFVKAPVVRYMTEMQVTQIMRSADDFTQAYPKDVAYALQRVSMGLGSGIYSAGSSLGSTVSKTLSPPRVAPGIPVDDED